MSSTRSAADVRSLTLPSGVSLSRALRRLRPHRPSFWTTILGLCAIGELFSAANELARGAVTWGILRAVWASGLAIIVARSYRRRVPFWGFVYDFSRIWPDWVCGACAFVFVALDTARVIP